jgi:hypothetical protein
MSAKRPPMSIATAAIESASGAVLTHRRNLALLD